MSNQIKENPKAIKVNPHDVEPICLSQRNNYKLVDPTTTGSKHLTFGMVIVEPFGTCEPGHVHDDQEEIFFCMTGNGIVIADDDRKEIPIGPKDAVFFPIGVYHSIKNPFNTPLEALWIISPAGWVFDRFPDMKKKAEEGQHG
jgi:mannose-6-phosphate isomerase-like protein (cupin superfamily)